MRTVHTCLVFFVVLVLGLSPATPAEDLPQTAYDESETQPYVGGLPTSNLMAQTVSATQATLWETQVVRKGLRLPASTPFPLSARAVTRTDAPRFTQARRLLAQVCTLLF
jgi:hypothetical protein